MATQNLARPLPSKTCAGRWSPATPAQPLYPYTSPECSISLAREGRSHIKYEPSRWRARLSLPADSTEQFTEVPHNQEGQVSFPAPTDQDFSAFSLARGGGDTSKTLSLLVFHLHSINSTLTTPHMMCQPSLHLLVCLTMPSPPGSPVLQNFSPIKIPTASLEALKNKFSSLQVQAHPPSYLCETQLRLYLSTVSERRNY